MTCTKCNGTGHYAPNMPQHKCRRCLGTGVPKLRLGYAGIGSRETPEAVLRQMENIAMRLTMLGFILRSGGAKGADQAFERGADVLRGAKVISGPTHWQPALDHAAQFHPAWDRCDERARALHARNSLIICGDDFDDPVRFVVCRTVDGAVTGGTGQAIRVARACGVPVFNLAVQATAEELFEGIDQGHV